MMFPPQVQKRCREQNQDLYIVFVDLTKAFDSVGRKGLWILLAKVGCPEKINIVRSFRDGMVGRFINEGFISDPFLVKNGTKQGCVMAPFLFNIVFSMMLHDAFNHCDKGVDHDPIPR